MWGVVYVAMAYNISYAVHRYGGLVGLFESGVVVYMAIGHLMV